MVLRRPSNAGRGVTVARPSHRGAVPAAPDHAGQALVAHQPIHRAPRHPMARRRKYAAAYTSSLRSSSLIAAKCFARKKLPFSDELRSRLAQTGTRSRTSKTMRHLGLWQRIEVAVALA